MMNVPKPTSLPAGFASGIRRSSFITHHFRFLVSLADQAAVSGTNFLSGVVIGRACSEAEFGRYGMALAAMLVLTEVGNALVGTPHQVMYPRLAAANRPRFNGATLWHAVGLAALVATGFLAAGAVAGGSTGSVLLALSVAAAAVLVRYYARLFSFTVLRPAAALVLDGTVCVLQLGGLIVLWRAGRLTPASALLVIAAANGLALSAWLLARRGDFARVTPRDAAGDLRRTWPLARWVFFSGLLWTLGMHTYPWLVGGLRGEAAAGAWAACFGIGALANPLMMGVQNLVGPAVAHEHAKDAGPAAFRRFVMLATVGFALAMVPFVAAAAVFGEVFLKLYGEGKYAGYGPVVALLAASTVAHALGFPSSRALMATGRARQDTMANVVVLIVLLTGGVWGDPPVRGAGGGRLARRQRVRRQRLPAGGVPLETGGRK